jgi:hypothetical protein
MPRLAAWYTLRAGVHRQDADATIHPDSEQGREGVDEKCEDNGVKAEGKDAVQQRKASHSPRRNLNIRDLTSHADDEREISEVEVSTIIVR